MAKLYRISSVLMAALFLVSASAQFNDPDWYFWIPLYSCAAYVNLMKSLASVSSKGITATGKLTLWLGIFLLTKVLLEDYMSDMTGFWSLDMRHKYVREKVGSGLVTSSMILQLSSKMDPTKDMELESYINCGMAILVGISYGLSLVFLMHHEEEIMF